MRFCFSEPLGTRNEKGRRNDLQPLLLLVAEKFLVEHFEQSCAALTAANAHGDHGVLGLAALSFLQDMAREARACHAEGMADRNRAAIHIVLGGIDMQRVAAVETLACERLVQFPKVDA